MSRDGEKSSLSVAILIVSDTAYEDPTTDRSGDALESVFQTTSNILWKIYERSIVPDAPHLIQRYLEKVVNECNLIITTGGTGFATKDVTPEAVEVLLDKKAPGLV
jgi:gephyrin